MRAVIPAVVLAALGFGGCSGPAEIVDRPSYPREATRLGTLDVQVFRDDASVRFTNTTTRPLGPGLLWANGGYSRAIERIPAGEGFGASLRTFEDRFGRPFRAGGFFATRDPDDLVLMELETDEGLVGLIVVDGVAER